MTARDVLTLLLGFGLEGIAAWLSVLCARRRPRQHRPVAAYLVLLAASDPFRTVLRLCRDTDAHHPLAGVARALYHLDACGFLASIAPSRPTSCCSPSAPTPSTRSSTCV
jgi:hypothetical protein